MDKFLTPMFFQALNTDNGNKKLLRKFETIFMISLWEEHRISCPPFSDMEIQFPYKAISKTLKSLISKAIYRNCPKFEQKVFSNDIFNLEKETKGVKNFHRFWRGWLWAFNSQYLQWLWEENWLINWDLLFSPTFQIIAP